MPSIKSHFKISLAIIFVVFFWSSSFVGIRYSLGHYQPGSMALFRYLIASICLLCVYPFIKKKSKLTSLEKFYVFIFGVIGFAIYNVALNYGEITVTAGISSFLIGCSPVISSIIAMIFLKERVSLLALIGMGISLIGLIIITVGESHQAHVDWGILYIIIATLSGAIYSGLHKILLKKITALEFTTYAIWSGTFVMLIYTPEMIHDIQHANLLSTSIVIYMGAFPGAIGYLCWSYLHSHLPVAKATSILYLLPLVATLMGVAFLHEAPPLTSFCGGLVALAGALLVTLAKQVPKHTADLSSLQK